MTEHYGKVAVLMGGWSAEREISLMSGAAILQALQSQGVDAHKVDVGRDICQVLRQGDYSRAFNIVHGRGGEDGEIQGLLEILQLPYTGSGLTASAMTMDKVVSKTIWAQQGLPTPTFRQIKDKNDLLLCAQQPGYPLVIKPVAEGSSVGVHIVQTANDVEPAWKDAHHYGRVIAEKFVSGAEYTVSILNNEPLPVIRVETPHVFYDYSAKYQANDTAYHIPCGLSANAETKMQQQALNAFLALGCEGWGRVDFMRDASGNNWLIEANTLPGMTSHSLVPKAARAAGISFENLVMQILDTSLDPDIGSMAHSQPHSQQGGVE